MYREIRELDRADLERPASGSVAAWVRVMVGFAALTAVGIAAVGARAAWGADGLATRLDEFWFRNGLALATAAAIALAFLPRARISRFVRLAAVLPLILIGGMLAAWAVWGVIAPRMAYVRHAAPLLLDVPAGAALALVLGATCLGATVVQPRGPGAWMRALVAVALVELLLLGLWLPLASAWWGTREGVGQDGAGFAFGSPWELLVLALGPPLFLATAFAALALHRPALLRRAGWLGPVALWLGVPIAIVARFFSSENARFVYLNLVHFLAASALVAAAALVALVASLWLRGRSLRRRLLRERAPVIGVIPDDPDDPRGVVACLELQGWLLGTRALVDAFEVATPRGRIPVPVGAELAAEVPAGSSILEVGEAVAVIRRGDRVVVGGLIEPAPDHPFRGAAALVPGPDGVVVRRLDDRGGGFAAIALVAWRPCVAFLVILTAVALPGLAAWIAPSWPILGKDF